MKRDIRVMDAFLREIHAAQVSTSEARITLDTEPIDSYRVFSMASPFRLIIDVRRRNQAPPQAQPHPETARPQPSGKPSGGPSLAQQLGLNVRRVILDPGHGGKDKGATSPNNIHEKDITLLIANTLKGILETEHGCEVILTRTRDRFMSLEERTAFANTQRADLFISIHTNAHEDHSLHGIETYFLNLSKDKESARVAALENAISTRKISDLEAILHDLMLNTKINESSHLATEVHGSIIAALRGRYEHIRDLGVKQAPFYVLLGAEMPSILVETAFITNEREERRLRDPAYQESLARAISTGIGTYIQHMKKFARAGDRS
jgi:N-acetylmuramoyl-L-alanine amidase